MSQFSSLKVQSDNRHCNNESMEGRWTWRNLRLKEMEDGTRLIINWLSPLHLFVTIMDRNSELLRVDMVDMCGLPEVSSLDIPCNFRKTKPDPLVSRFPSALFVRRDRIYELDTWRYLRKRLISIFLKGLDEEDQDSMGEGGWRR